MDKWAIVQYENRPLSESIKQLIKINKEYCEKHNYTYIFESKLYNMPPYWIKVLLVKEILETGNYKGILWMDSDAVINNMNTKFEDLVKVDRSFYYCKDAPRFPSPFNAGVWLVINNIIGKSLLNEWLNLYNKNDWKKSPDGSWVSNGGWSGETYEQGSFIKFIIPKYHKSLHKFHWRKFQSVEKNKAAFTLHFAGEYKDENMPTYIRQTRKNKK